MCSSSTGPDPECLAARIREILGRGVPVGTESLAFIASTLASADPGHLAACLEQADGVEAAPVLALLFFPEQGLQLEVEEQLRGRALTPAQEALLTVRLATPPFFVSFEFPEGGGCLNLEMTPERARQSVGHLRLTRAVPPELNAVIDATLCPADAGRFRVLWRNARCRPAPAASGFIGRLLKGLDLSDPEGWGGLDFILEWLNEIGAETDLFRALAERKRRLAEALERGSRQQAERGRGTLETLISRGVRLVGVDTEQIRRQMAWIDRVCLAAWGRMAEIDIPADPL
jgi:hypothetical protein